MQKNDEDKIEEAEIIEPEYEFLPSAEDDTLETEQSDLAVEATQVDIPQEKPQKKKNWMGCKIVLALLGVIMLLGACAFVYLGVQSFIDSRNVEVSSYTDSFDFNQEEFRYALSNSDVEIVASGNEKIQVELTGPKKMIEKITVDKSSKKVTIKENFKWDFGFFNFLNQNNKIQGTIRIPSRMNLTIDIDGASNLNVSNIESVLNVSINGASNIMMSNTISKDSKIKLNGTGSVIMDKCVGELDIFLNGSGEILANECTLTKLKINSTGTGEINIQQGAIENADIKSTGTVNIGIPKVYGNMKQDISGLGKVKINE